MRTPFLLVTLLCGTSVLADETFVPATPMTSQAIVRWRVDELRLVRTEPTVVVRLTAIGADNTCIATARGMCHDLVHAWSGEEARQILNTLEHADLSGVSLTRRVLQRLRADGVLTTGTVEGTPGLPTPGATP